MQLNEIKVEEFTSPLLMTIAPDEPLQAALSLMAAEGIRHLPVKENNELVGILSERDLLPFVGRSWAKQIRVADVMHSPILTVYANESLGDVAFRLSSAKVGSAVVLDLQGKVAGIFTTTDALNALVEILRPESRQRSDLTI